MTVIKEAFTVIVDDENQGLKNLAIFSDSFSVLTSFKKSFSKSAIEFLPNISCLSALRPELLDIDLNMACAFDTGSNEGRGLTKLRSL